MKLNDSQLRQLAESTSNLGLIFFGTVVTPIFTTKEEIDAFMIISGMILTIASVILSLILLKGVNDKS